LIIQSVVFLRGASVLGCYTGNNETEPASEDFMELNMCWHIGILV